MGRARGGIGTAIDVSRHAVRSAGRSPGWAGLVAGVLGVGLGATVAVVAVVDTVALRPLPYPDSDELVRIGVEREGRPGFGTISHPNYLDLASATRTLASTSAFTAFTMGARTGDTSELVRGGWVTGGFFETLGVGAAEGRVLASADDDPGAPLAVVASAAFATRRFGEGSAIGRSIEIDGSIGTIVGVMPASFVPPEGARMADTELWAPLAHAPLPVLERDLAFLEMAGRRVPDASQAAVEREAASIGAALVETHSLDPRAFAGLTVGTLREATLGDVGRTLGILTVSVLLLLAIAVLNASNLVLLRAFDRVDALRIRVSLGATRVRVVAESVAESVFIAAAGGLLGLAAASVAVEWVAASRPVALPRLIEATVDLRVAAFGVGVSVLAGALAGLVPAMVAVRRSGRDGTALGGTARGLTSRGGRGARRLRDGVVVAQIALGLALAGTATLLGRSLLEMRRVPIGLDSEGLYVATLRIAGIGGDDFDPAVLRTLVNETRRQPGVVAAELGSGSPYTPGGRVGYIEPEGVEVSREDRIQARIEFHRVGGGTLEMLGIPVLSGRSLSATDRADSEPVVVVSRSVAEAWFGTASPLGRRLVVGGDGTFTPRTVVGVASNPRYRGPRGEVEQHVWIPYEQMYGQALDLRVRMSDAGSADRAIAAAAGAVPGVELRGVRSVSAQLEESYLESTFFALLFGFFAIGAVLFAVVGLYSTLAQNIRSRRRELGIRMALGAGTRRIVRDVLRHGAGITILGIVAGSGLALVASRLASTLLFGVAPGDGRAWAAAVATLLITGVAASGLPAWRAGRTDPTRSLRPD